MRGQSEKLVYIISILLTLLVGSTFTVHAQTTRITVSYAGESPTHLPAWVAADAGIFLKNSLDAQLIRARSDISIMALVSGEVSFAQPEQRR